MGGYIRLTLHVNSIPSEAAYCLHAAGSPLEASTCGCFHKPFRSLNAGVKGWGLAGRHDVDCRGPNNAANAHLVTDGDVNTLFVHKMASLGTLTDDHTATGACPARCCGRRTRPHVAHATEACRQQLHASFYSTRQRVSAAGSSPPPHAIVNAP